MTRLRNRDEKAAWLDLMETDGLFLAVPVVKDAWPSGLETIDKTSVEALRVADDQLTASAGTRPPEWLSTHPDPKSRIGELRKRADALMPTYEQSRVAGRKPKCG